MDQIVWLWNCMKGKRAAFSFGLILTAVTAGIRIVNPMLGQRIIDEVIVLGDTQPLVPLLIIMLVVQLVRLSLRYLMIIMMEIASTSVMTTIRRDMYKTVQWQDFRFLGRFPTGNLMTRMTQDLDMVRHTAAWISYNIVESIVLFLSTFIFLIYINWRLALCLVAVTPFILIISSNFVKKIRPRFRLLRQKLTDLGTSVTENIDGNRVVKAFAREEHETKRFEKYNAEYRDTSCENALIVARYHPLLEVISQSLMVIMLAVGGVFLINEWITAGEYMAFSSMTWALSVPMWMLGPLLADLERFSTAGKMIQEVVEAPKGIGDMSGAIELNEKPSGKIEFRDVKLSINGSPILEDINFIIEAGSTVGILGSTGAGKTSLINILARFYEPDWGAVLLDGEDIRRYTLSSLRQHIGLAMQDVFLFSDSVKGNISYGRPETDDENIKKFAVQSDADNFIREMSEGYDTLVGERGVGISGGQRQRIALARALAVRPSILILDDTTSAVDSETEQYIQDQLKNLDFPCTKIIIAQRISSFRGADQILVMDNGRIIEKGTHSQLIAAKGFYYNIWKLQYNAGLDAISGLQNTEAEK
ncbi:MAG: ABC transporter ATP-binding protein/permease [Treponema sp.]|nr:ABC transporter ATP-binding protein/permease [Treponema sp.]MCL2272099.1 ABC transporter ATP-binding protein/permease [Treponema sp.]